MSDVVTEKLTAHAGKSATSLGAFAKSVGMGIESIVVGVWYAISDSILNIEAGIGMPTEAHR